MTPQEKAEEICRKMLYQIEWNAQPSTVKGVAKQCALIAVDEMYNIAHNLDDMATVGYLVDVITEIEKL